MTSFQILEQPGQVIEAKLFSWNTLEIVVYRINYEVLCNMGRPWTPHVAKASTSQVLGLEAHMTRPGLDCPAHFLREEQCWWVNSLYGKGLCLR